MRSIFELISVFEIDSRKACAVAILYLWWVALFFGPKGSAEIRVTTNHEADNPKINVSWFWRSVLQLILIFKISWCSRLKCFSRGPDGFRSSQAIRAKRTVQRTKK